MTNSGQFFAVTSRTVGLSGEGPYLQSTWPGISFSCSCGSRRQRLACPKYCLTSFPWLFNSFGGFWKVSGRFRSLEPPGEFGGSLLGISCPESSLSLPTQDFATSEAVHRERIGSGWGGRHEPSSRGQHPPRFRISRWACWPYLRRGRGYLVLFLRKTKKTSDV